MSINTSATTDKEALEYMYNLGVEYAKTRLPAETIDIKGATYLVNKRDGSLTLMRPVDPNAPSVLSIYTLQGLVDFIKADVDGIFTNPDRRHIIRVASEDLVEVLTPLTGEKNVRHNLAQVRAAAPEIDFDDYMDSEDMSVMLMTKFEPTEGRAAVLAIVGNLVSDQATETADDGFSQRVIVKRGVAMKGKTTIENPVTLIPMRTFAEVAQPESPFVLRLNDKHQVALFQADGGEWKVRAVTNIRDWLRGQLADCNVEIIA